MSNSNSITTKRFVIRKSLIGTNTIVTFTNKKDVTYSYDYTNSNNLPTWAREHQVETK